MTAIFEVLINVAITGLRYNLIRALKSVRMEYVAP